MKLKTGFIAIALALASLQALAYEIEVTTTSKVIAPKASPSRSEKVAWTNGLVVAQGDYVTNTNTPALTYWAVTGGTSTAMPTNGIVSEVETGADTIVWQYIPERPRTRKNVIIFSDENTKVYYDEDAGTATVGNQVLDAIRPIRAFPMHQGDIKAVTASGTATINVKLDY